MNELDEIAGYAWWTTAGVYDVGSRKYNVRIADLQGRLLGPGEALVSVNRQDPRFDGYTGEPLDCSARAPPLMPLPPPPPPPPPSPQPSPSPSQKVSPPPLGRPPPLPTLDSCQSWCGAHPASWSVKCTAVASCAGCAACRLVPPPSSMAYDPMPPLPSPFYLRSPPPAVPTLPPPSPPTPAPVILIPSPSSPAPPHAASPHSCAGAEEQPLQDLTCRLSEFEMSLACSCQYVWAATCAKPIAVRTHCVQT